MGATPGPGTGTVERLVDELYAVAPEQFVERRDQLARELRAAGRAADAKRVRALRRPTVAAWAVNQLARVDPDGLGQLFEAGSRLRAAQQELAGRDDAARLRDAAQERRKRIERLVDVATGLLDTRTTRSDSSREGITNTLEAASLDPEAQQLVAAGRLTKELPRPAGFGDAGVTPMPAAPRARDELAPARARRALEAARRAAVEAEDAARARAAEAADAREAADAAARRVERLQHELADARVAARAAKDQAARAERAASKARADAERAADAQRAAEGEVARDDR